MKLSINYINNWLMPVYQIMLHLKEWLTVRYEKDSFFWIKTFLEFQRSQNFLVIYFSKNIMQQQ